MPKMQYKMLFLIFIFDFGRVIIYPYPEFDGNEEKKGDIL